MNDSTEQSNIMPKLSIMMFLQFWIWGSWYVSIPNYIGTLDYMGFEAYYAYEAGPLAAMIAPFFLGLFADRFFNTEKILAFLFLGAGACMFCLPVIGDLQGTVVQISDASGEMKEALQVSFLGTTWLKHKLFSTVTLIHMLCFMPTLALTASISFQHLKKGGNHFPLVRLWGTFGWIFAGIALPLIYNQYEMIDGIKQVTIKGEETAGQFTIGGWAAVSLGIFSLIALPKTPAPKKGQKINMADLFFLDVWKEFKRPSFFIFVLCSFLICIPLQAYYAYLQTQMGAQGFSNITIWKNTGTWIEAFMMFAMPFFFRKLGVKKMITIGIGAWVLRYALFPLAASYGIIPADSGININGFQVPFTNMAFLFIIGGVMLHGLCYDFFFVTGQVYVDQVTDKKIRGQAQSMIIFFTQGLGMYIGAKLNWYIFTKVFNADYAIAGAGENAAKWADFWWPLCGIAAVILVVFLITFKHKDKEGAELTH